MSFIVNPQTPKYALSFMFIHRGFIFLFEGLLLKNEIFCDVKLHFDTSDTEQIDWVACRKSCFKILHFCLFNRFRLPQENIISYFKALFPSETQILQIFLCSAVPDQVDSINIIITKVYRLLSSVFRNTQQAFLPNRVNK